MTLLRRFLVVQILMLWQGGFLFYASFVVPTGTEVLGSTEAQGAITARVTESLNLCGVAGVVLLAWELIASRDPSRRRYAIRWLCWLVAAACQVVLFWMHDHLRELMDPTGSFVQARARFYRIHGIYLWITTVQWAACLVWMWFTLKFWSAPESLP